jgi:hypothetical protein
MTLICGIAKMICGIAKIQDQKPESRGNRVNGGSRGKPTTDKTRIAQICGIKSNNWRSARAQPPFPLFLRVSKGLAFDFGDRQISVLSVYQW